MEEHIRSVLKLIDGQEYEKSPQGRCELSAAGKSDVELLKDGDERCAGRSRTSGLGSRGESIPEAHLCKFFDI